MNVNELSEELEAEPRQVRQFLRENTPKPERPGRGHRWEVDPQGFQNLKRKFREWQAA